MITHLVFPVQLADVDAQTKLCPRCRHHDQLENSLEDADTSVRYTELVSTIKGVLDSANTSQIRSLTPSDQSAFLNGIPPASAATVNSPSTLTWPILVPASFVIHVLFMYQHNGSFIYIPCVCGIFSNSLHHSSFGQVQCSSFYFNYSPHLLVSVLWCLYSPSCRWVCSILSAQWQQLFHGK